MGISYSSSGTIDPFGTRVRFFVDFRAEAAVLRGRREDVTGDELGVGRGAVFARVPGDSPRSLRRTEFTSSSRGTACACSAA